MECRFFGGLDIELIYEDFEDHNHFDIHQKKSHNFYDCYNKSLCVYSCTIYSRPLTKQAPPALRGALVCNYCSEGIYCAGPV